MENHQSPIYPLCQYPGIVAGTSRIWEKYLSFGTRKIYAKNASLNYNRDHNRYFAYIQSGMVTMSFIAANGNEKKQLICAEGSLIYEAQHISGYSAIEVESHCNERCVFCLFDAERVKRELLPGNLELSLNLGFSQSVKLLKVLALFNATTTRSKNEQLCWFIHSMSAAHGMACEFNPHISQAQMAGLLGLPSSTLKRSMTWLKDEGIVSIFTKKRILIANMQKLEAFAFPAQ